MNACHARLLAGVTPRPTRRHTDADTGVNTNTDTKTDASPAQAHCASFAAHRRCVACSSARARRHPALLVILVIILGDAALKRAVARPCDCDCGGLFIGGIFCDSAGAEGREACC